MNLFLTFPGNAADAIEFYLRTLPGATISDITYCPEGEKVLNAQMTYQGETLMFMDLDDCPPFSWSASLYVETESEEEFQSLFSGLKDGGTVMMGPEPAGKMALVAWATDKFGLTWQLAWEGRKKQCPDNRCLI